MKLTVFNILFTLSLLILTLLVEQNVEYYLAYFFIISIGILHGSNDILLISHITKNNTNKLKYTILYIILILFTAIIFSTVPSFALLFFVIMSCYHFGEQHFHNKISNPNFSIKSIYMSYGMLIFGLIFYLNYEDTTIVINELTGYTMPERLFLSLIIFGSLLTTILLVMNRKKLGTNFKWFLEVSIIIILICVFKFASLIWAFAIYFVVWHSIPSLKNQIEELHGQINKVNFVKYFKASLINWIISVIGILVVYYLSDYFNIRFITLFFGFLAAITIPHVVVMYFLNQKTD